MSDALSLLRETVPERIWKFCETLLGSADLDVHAAAAAAGAPGQARALLEDRRSLVVLGALRNDLRETNKNLRHQLVGMLARMATFDPADAFVVDGQSFKNIHAMPPEIRAAIEKVKIKPSGEMEIAFCKRLDAIKLLFTLFGDIDSPQAQLGTARVVFRGRDEP